VTSIGFNHLPFMPSSSRSGGQLKGLRVRVFGIIFITFLFFSCSFAASSPEEIIQKATANFSLIKDAKAEIVLDAGLQFVGCGGMQRQTGSLWFKAPDKVKVYLDGTYYYIKGNSIRKIDETGQRFYVRLINAPDFSVGFSPALIPHNFNLKLLQDNVNEAVIEGIPKPGVLKNVYKVTFHVAKPAYLVNQLDLAINHNRGGRIFINYANQEGAMVPTETFGRSALELNAGLLVGLNFDLKGQNFIINSGLSDALFEAGF